LISREKEMGLILREKEMGFEVVLGKGKIRWKIIEIQRRGGSD